MPATDRRSWSWSTYRRLGHSSSDDPTRYRDAAEVEAWEKRDPVERFGRYLRGRDLWDDAREQELQDRIAQEVNAAIKEAEAAAAPPPETLITDVYAEPTPQLEEQLATRSTVRRHPIRRRSSPTRRRPSREP